MNRLPHAYTHMHPRNHLPFKLSIFASQVEDSDYQYQYKDDMFSVISGEFVYNPYVVPPKVESVRTRPSEANDASFSDFFIFHFLATFSFFHSPRPSFLLSLFFPRPELSKHLTIRICPFFIDFDKSIVDQPTNGSTDRPTDGQGLL